MAKVLGLHEFELNPGVNTEEFERFISEEFVHQQTYPGVRYTVLKGVQGRRIDQYMMVYEFESIETFRRLVSPTGELSEEMMSHYKTEAVQKVWSRVHELGRPVDPNYTDYVVLGTVG